MIIFIKWLLRIINSKYCIVPIQRFNIDIEAEKFKSNIIEIKFSDLILDDNIRNLEFYIYSQMFGEFIKNKVVYITKDKTNIVNGEYLVSGICYFIDPTKYKKL